MERGRVMKEDENREGYSCLGCSSFSVFEVLRYSTIIEIQGFLSAFLLISFIISCRYKQMVKIEILENRILFTDEECILARGEQF